MKAQETTPNDPLEEYRQITEEKVNQHKRKYQIKYEGIMELWKNTQNLNIKRSQKNKKQHSSTHF